MSRVMIRFSSNESGAVSIEYALIGSLVSIGIVSACFEIGEIVSGMFSQLAAGFIQ